jgi:hypothetical protein
MNLYEEMKLWEAMWEDKVENFIDEKTEKIVDDLLGKVDDFVIEYEGFDEEYDEDHWDYSSESHYQTTSTVHYGDFEYEVDAGDVWEGIVNLSQEEIEKHKFTPSTESSEVLNTFIKLQKEAESAPKDQSTLYWNRLGVFVAENLDKLFNIFYSYFQDEYEELAYEWARESLDPDWD